MERQRHALPDRRIPQGPSSVSSGNGSLEDPAVAQFFVDDDAFGNRDFNAYRFEGKT